MWTKRDFASCFIAAFTVFAASLVLVYPTLLTAKAPPAQDNPTPTLRFDHFTVQAHLPDSPGPMASIVPGDLPKLQIEVTNTGKNEATAEFAAEVTMASVADMLSRVPKPKSSQPDWTSQFTIKLAPGETRQIEVGTQLKLPAATTARLTLHTGQNQILALSVYAQPPKADDTVAIADKKPAQ